MPRFQVARKGAAPASGTLPEKSSETAAHDPGAHLGHRLRLRRKVRNLSLQDVADRAELSIGLLSQIERGFTSPSVRSLSAICRALEMPVGWLFDGNGPEDEADRGLIVRRHRRRVLDFGAKGMVKELMTPDESTGIQMMRMIFRPGGSSGESPFFQASGTRCGTVLSGVLGLEVEGRSFTLEAGDSYAFEATRPMRCWCIGNEETVLLSVITPAVY